MSDEKVKNGQSAAENPEQETENIKFTEDTLDAETDNLAEDAEAAFPGLDENMLGQVQEMMAKLEKADELEKENNDLKVKLSRLATDFEMYRTRTAQDVTGAEGQGIAKAAEALMPIYDDLDRAVTSGVTDPSKLIPGVQAVQGKVLSIFAGLGLEATGKEGEHFDPQWHEALQVVPGEQDDVIVQVYQLGFRMGDKLVRPARVVVSRKG